MKKNLFNQGDWKSAWNDDPNIPFAEKGAHITAIEPLLTWL
ncbi:hypothetical protein [Paenibacillus sp. FSL H8-0034]